MRLVLFNAGMRGLEGRLVRFSRSAHVDFGIVEGVDEGRDGKNGVLVVLRHVGLERQTEEFRTCVDKIVQRGSSRSKDQCKITGVLGDQYLIESLYSRVDTKARLGMKGATPLQTLGVVGPSVRHRLNKDSEISNGQYCTKYCKYKHIYLYVTTMH